MAMNFNIQNEAEQAIINAAPLQEKSSATTKKAKEKKNKVISITLRQSDLEIMEDLCAKTGMSRSNLIRLAVQDYVEKYSRK